MEGQGIRALQVCLSGDKVRVKMRQETQSRYTAYRSSELGTIQTSDQEKSTQGSTVRVAGLFPNEKTTLD